jgi:hypothetical protein
MVYRGITPENLIAQVRSTMPFLFEESEHWAARAPHLRVLLNEQEALASRGASAIETEFEYFRLCLVVHHATVSSFVPTDVDNHIRFKLWQNIDDETLTGMAQLVLESRNWDCRPVSARWVASPLTGKLLSGHAGEWFSTAVAAYAATRKRLPELAALIAAEIRDEVALEASIFSDFLAAADGLNTLRAATLIAHNLGDLQRVIDAWNIGSDPRADFDRAGNAWHDCACELNRVKMAAENHRHLTLRKPRCLRRSIEFFLPLGPFLDDWGAMIAKHPLLNAEDVAEITEALLEGLERTPGSIAYTRALAGIESRFPGGPTKLQSLVPAKDARKLKSGAIRNLIAVPRPQFDRQWASFALKFSQDFLSQRNIQLSPKIREKGPHRLSSAATL